ncbi:uncharacterized protein (DUF849 family) [Novosphingobium hassiacum]|uniref:Uncharacterized protein (DUF849 family) n=1 Tax=Novosphingobium hassiacum TaxID=173676 RepID=A0A7W5ZZR0_9SPHN|nr:3-keto-5-aminohexanoate cleavage protein [Novosphingobium hassiacum]MBB3861292.1 uncharacterized protein (DUF849 family) [Novosphingobium hassiacum]
MSGSETPVIVEAAVSLEKAGGIAVLADNASPAIDVEAARSALSERSLYGPTLAGARASLDAGASIIHHHQDIDLSIEQQVAQVVRMNEEILATHPHALIYPAPLLTGTTHAEVHQHYPALAQAGCLTMIAVELGRTVFAVMDETGLPNNSWVNGQTYSEAHDLVMLANKHQTPLALGIYTPSMCYWIREYAERGLLPKGTMVKIWFGGRYKVWTNREPTVRNALAPTVKALDAYLEALEGVDLPWLIATQGDNVLDTPVARYALEKGGHIRVGEEDVSGTTQLRNGELVEAAIALAASVGRPVVSGAAAREYLGVKARNAEVA